MTQSEGYSGALAFTQSPADGLGAVALFPVPIVTVRTLAGATDAGFSGAVRLGMISEGEEFDSFTMPAVAGVAAFVGLVVGSTGTISLKASAPGKSVATTAEFNLS